MTLENIQQILFHRKEEFLEKLFTLLRQKSISTTGDEMTEGAELLKEMMEEIGISAAIMETDGHPAVYGEMIKDENQFTVLFYGHYDVQPPEPLEDWTSPPFEPVIRDGRIYARGAGDNKGQLMATLMGIRTYMELFKDLPVNVKFLYEGEEENGSPHLEAFVEKHKDLLQADLVYTADGSSHNSGAPLLLLGARGSLQLELKVKEAEWDNHSGNTGNIVPNPAWRMMNLLQTMRDSEGRVLIEGFYDHIRKATVKEKELLRNLPYDAEDIGEKIGYPALDLDGEAYYHKLTMEPTFNIAGFSSGYGGEGVKTIIPSEAKVKLDIRLVVDQDPQDIYEKVCRHIEKHDPGVEVKHLVAMEPSRTPADLEIVGVVTEAVSEAYELEPIIQPSLGSSLPVYVWTNVLETPSIIVPYANFDQRNHAPNENMKVDYFLNGIACTCHVLHKLGEYAANRSE